MNKQRRRLMQASLIGGAAAASGLLGAGTTLADAHAKRLPNTPDKLRFLILGGTGFIGPHMVQEALRRGHSVELFNRGRTNSDLFPDLVTHVGDRNSQLDALKDGEWDVVIDNSGYVPRHVAESAELLASRAKQYIFISSISVYADFGKPMPEDAPVGKLEDETVEEVTNETYGPLKALCEQRAAENFGEDRVAVLRPTYICGPRDRTDRYTYWPVRTMRGGEMIWPGTPDDVIQIIDVRDLANFAIDVGERQVVGTYNTVNPPGSLTMGRLLEDSLAVTGADTEAVWIDHAFLDSLDAAGGRQLPIWVPPVDEYAHAALVPGDRAYAQGLAIRPSRETARDTIAWWKTLPEERRNSLRAGYDAETEAKVLAAWKARDA